ncbi:MAG: lytic transglycosylase domain-containing protein [Actinomycetia bacterium]|nr:lytic transglycosylase domain-containing protein [Actinomycetes bacterium]
MTRSELQRLADTTARRHGLSAAAFRALIDTESSWNPRAYRHEPAFFARYIRGRVEWSRSPWGQNSRRSAASYGLGQLMYTTAVQMGFPRNRPPEELYDPALNLDLTARKWRSVLARAGGNPAEAYSLYNSGLPLDRAPASTRDKHVPRFLALLAARRGEPYGTTRLADPSNWLVGGLVAIGLYLAIRRFA